MITLTALATAVLAEEEFDPNTVTPGVIGFVITFLVALATLLLVIDMTRRVRRTRYRAEVREQFERERAEGRGPGEQFPGDEVSGDRGPGERGPRE
ncbi:hypothetical protein [Desertivibrio insolitus]|uniref:hypothetical protein n=1 Tax=Herbiconiux sp. SYSU D00978 TaxID=2812562 RepID=UPI001A9666DA|nr:hypothetical protein [Herbiconiux sp. SYSU D00978]